MSEYLSKKAVLEWLTEQYFHGMGEEAWNTAISKLQEKIESGAFDAPEMEHINAYWAREGLIKHQEAEVQRLRAAAIKLHETLNTYWQGDCEKADVVAVQSKLCDVLGADRDDELYGDWTDERCPKCGANLLGNKVGDKWCSMVGCDYGLRETDSTVDESRVCGMDCPSGRCEG